MEELKEKGIRAIVDASIKNFVEGFEFRHLYEKENSEGTINMKKNNCFIAELGDEFVFYSAFVRSFDSSFVAIDTVYAGIVVIVPLIVSVS